jgi:hypothetical protein
MRPCRTTSTTWKRQIKLEYPRLKLDKDTSQDQVTEFHIFIQKLEAARVDKLEHKELWSLVTSTIKGTTWEQFRLTVQSEFKDKRSSWFIDQVREYTLALEDSSRDFPLSLVTSIIKGTTWEHFKLALPTDIKDKLSSSFIDQVREYMAS